MPDHPTVLSEILKHVPHARFEELIKAHGSDDARGGWTAKASWWAQLHAADCRIVTRFKTNTPLTVEEERAVPPASGDGGVILSDRVGRLPERQAGRRKNPFQARGAGEDRDRHGAAHPQQRSQGPRPGHRRPPNDAGRSSRASAGSSRR